MRNTQTCTQTSIELTSNIYIFLTHFCTIYSLEIMLLLHEFDMKFFTLRLCFHSFGCARFATERNIIAYATINTNGKRSVRLKVIVNLLWCLWRTFATANKEKICFYLVLLKFDQVVLNINRNWWRFLQNAITFGEIFHIFFLVKIILIALRNIVVKLKVFFVLERDFNEIFKWNFPWNF